MEIRAARAADAEAVNALLGELGYVQASRAATADRIRVWLNDPASAVYVYDADGVVQGVIAVHVCRFFEREGSWGRVTALVVSSQVRGRGVGSRLLKAAEDFAVDNGCVRMEVTSADRRSDAHAFYARRGYLDQAGRSSRFLRDLAQVAK
jgi:GNAT superfamily N-acetyltransferase